MLSPRLQSLFERRLIGVKFTLDGMESLTSSMGHPERALRFVHIAGTNGKGSVGAMCSAIFQKAGLRTGLYTSPHLLDYKERFRLNGLEIEEEELTPILEEVLGYAADATFFELSTAVALRWFSQKQTEIVVWETGLGGKFDATNVVNPQVSVITHIGKDHTDFLGQRLSEIAEQKAGIIKKERPVVTPRQDAEILDVLIHHAHEQRAALKIIEESELDEFPSPLSGDHQRWNTALAVHAVREIFPGIDPNVIREGLAGTYWPGRCQLVERGGGAPPILIDGAHNPLGAKALVHQVRQLWGNRKVTLIFGALADKAVGEMAAIFSDVARQVIFTPVRSERSSGIDQLTAVFPAGVGAANFGKALARADSSNHPIVVCGSLFLAAEALEFLGLKSGRGHPNELLKKR